jgi:CBS domain containing-hemolysin-like protein
VLKPSISVPSTKNCAELLVEMRESNSEMAVVIDEYGGTAGVITFKDLIEQLLGYFYPSGETQILELPEGRYRVAGHLKIEDLSALLEQEIPSDSHTVAGLITDTLEEIPSVGTTLVIGALEFTVKRISKTRILELEVRRLPR